jgi:hypothetical protein
LDAVQKIGQGQGGVPSGPSGTPDGNDVDRFKVALQGPQTDPAGTVAGVSGNPAPSAIGGTPPTDGTSPAGMGDRILSGLSDASQKIQEGRTTAVETLGKENVTQADLIQAQFAMMESSTLVSAVSKTAEKITQGLKTLQQG